MKIELDHEWIPVQVSPEQRYIFPCAVTPYLRDAFSGPAIYRWVVYEREPGDLRRLYVGEADQLPRRLYHYLHPGPSQQTNLRLNAEFLRETQAGRSVTLEVLRFKPFEFEGANFSMGDLEDKLVRRFLENLFGAYFSKIGHVVLNA